MLTRRGGVGDNEQRLSSALQACLLVSEVLMFWPQEVQHTKLSV